MYARAREFENEEPTFDKDEDKPDVRNSHEITIRSKLANDEASTIAGIIPENCPEFAPRADGVSDGTDTDHYMEPNADSSSEQHNSTRTSPVPAE